MKQILDSKTGTDIYMLSADFSSFNIISPIELTNIRNTELKTRLQSRQNSLQCQYNLEVFPTLGFEVQISMRGGADSIPFNLITR